ncbi:modifier of mdg4-like isoform X30 [Chironomus tepperi]|uniref:modifier of mdg4-like isoform X30 n=1 Tax=Chironomus tepperi TaxID=113505 RepID=UPI00391F3789
MADEEQFSLCWNNFNTNLSAGFHESLCRGDLVDVTLAAEGQLVKAHRLVLSVCSPYFRKMFTQMPANQHAFVFLKDVSSSALKDLIQFMYCGEVNVRQEALPAFISTAEALQIKGLTESNEAVTATGSSSPTKEVITSTPLPDTASIRARGTVRSVSNRPQAFKIESEGSSDEKQTVTLVQNQPVKRIARQSIPTSAPKRVKTQLSQETPDPLDAPDHEIVTPQQLKETTEFIDLPIETTSLNPKTEPEYVEDTQEIETEQDDDNQYVEDVTYGEEKYEESYFTEGDDNKAGVSGFSETYATEGDQSATEAQVKSSYSKIVEPNISRVVTYDGKLLQTNGDLEVVKQLNNGHALCHLKRKRVRGYCVECIKKLGSSIDYKKVLEKIFTYCPACKSGPWFCNLCFDESHDL